MTTAYSFANYEDCCHKNHLPRPKVIFPMYGLDWNIKALPEDKGLAVFFYRRAGVMSSVLQMWKINCRIREGTGQRKCVS